MADAAIPKTAAAIGHWMGVTSTLVATVTAIFTTHLAVSVNQRNARDQFFDRQLQACTDLGDASLPLEDALSQMAAGFSLITLGYKPQGEAALDKSQALVEADYADYQKMSDRFFVLYPDSFTPYQAKIAQFTPTTLRDRAETAADQEAAFKTLRDGFSDADIKLRGACTHYLRDYAKANLMDEPK